MAAPENDEITEVMFRMDPPSDGGECFAIFPGIPGTEELHTCMTYQHVGQHASGDLQLMVQLSRPAKPAECLALAEELKGMGYKLKVIHRATQRLQNKRLRALEAMRRGNG